MRTLKNTLGTLLMTALIVTSCNTIDDDQEFLDIPATAQEFQNLKNEALDKLTQEFQFNAEDGYVTFTSAKGVEIDINGACLTLDGSSVTGNVNLEFVELFEKGNMLTTNKSTMGILPNGDRAMLVSGGEFFINATQNGEGLRTNCGVNVRIPTNLSGGDDHDMVIWKGIEDEKGNVAWEEERDQDGGKGNIFIERGTQGGNQYYALFGGFGWSNVDRFYSDPRPKTQILVDVPAGYDNDNSAVYLSYDGEETGLANLDTYDVGLELFSEHYGQIPIGLECHVIFATEENGMWKYAVKAVTIVDNGTVVISDGETALVTETELTTIINGLP
jgi:hypothetical protein